MRTALAAGMLLPWLGRGAFPVNSFSANYKTPGFGGTTPLIRFLYRMKKWQYLLYKHCLLHGLNVSVALREGGAATSALVRTGHFRLYCARRACPPSLFCRGARSRPPAPLGASARRRAVLERGVRQ